MATLKLSTVQQIIQDRNLPPEETQSLMLAVGRAASVPDTWIYRIVVIALGLALFIPLVPILTGNKDTAQMLLPLATGALGALAGLLAPSPGG